MVLNPVSGIETPRATVVMSSSPNLKFVNGRRQRRPSFYAITRQRQFGVDVRSKGQLDSQNHVCHSMLFDQEEEFSVWY